MRILQGDVFLYLPLGIGLIGPTGLVIDFTLKSGKNTAIVAGEFECRIDQKTEEDLKAEETKINHLHSVVEEIRRDIAEIKKKLEQ